MDVTYGSHDSSQIGNCVFVALRDLRPFSQDMENCSFQFSEIQNFGIFKYPYSQNFSLPRIYVPRTEELTETMSRRLTCLLAS
jgi:hypothetical protein